MEHRKWSLFGAGAESMEGAMREHNALYDAWVVEGDRADDLLKDRNAIQQKLDEARKRIAELESPIRVPFSDDQIERMAKAARNGFHEGNEDPVWDDCHYQDEWRQGIRAALAAGGLEPCAVPSDVGVTYKMNPANSGFEGDPKPSDDEVEKLARVLDDAYEIEAGGTPMWPDQSSYHQDRRRAQAHAAIAHLSKRPEGLPTAEELAKIGADAWNACAGERHLGVRDRARATAIRDAVLAGLATIAPPAARAALEDE